MNVPDIGRVERAGNAVAPAFRTAGPDGNLWFTAGSGPNAATDPAIGQITTHGAAKEFSTGITPHSTPIDITEANGDLWLTWSDALQRPVRVH